MRTLKAWWAAYQQRKTEATVIDEPVRIELVRENGRLVGRTESDRWNLMTLGYEFVDSRNQADIKKARREWGNEFTFSVAYGATRESATETEIQAIAA